MKSSTAQPIDTWDPSSVAANQRSSRLRRVLIHGARTRIVAWVLVVVLGALTLVTLATWRLLVADTDARIDVALHTEIEEFIGLTASRDGAHAPDEPAVPLDQVLRSAIADNTARPNEKFIAYIDGNYRYQSRVPAPVPLGDDEAFTALVARITQPIMGTYDSGAGPVRYRGVPITLQGRPGHGVVVAAYFVDQEREAANKASRLMAAAGAVTALLAAIAAWAVAGQILRPVRDIASTARAITETDLSSRIPTSPAGAAQDEIGELVQAVNSMLDRIESGVSAQRRFVDDASHELRTPITIIRGHLDVVDLDDRADLHTALELVDDELDRMSRIVTDMLVLAKANQPEFVLPELTDVRSLLVETLAKAQRLAPRQWSVSLPATESTDLDQPGTEAVLDAQRITQALLVLAHNAVGHTNSGDSIIFGFDTSADHSSLRLTVSDTGLGVPVADRTRIFERFARGSNERRSEGAGLGLAIASAIATAHGGTVEVADGIGTGRPPHSGIGATFTIAIPQYPLPPEALTPHPHSSAPTSTDICG